MNPVTDWFEWRISQLKAERDRLDERLTSITEKKTEVEAKLNALEIASEEAQRTSGILPSVISEASSLSNEPDEGNSRTFKVVLHKSMYNFGFFNVPRAFDHLVAQTDERPVILHLHSGERLEARADRNQNTNSTARIIGRAALRNWFKRMYSMGDSILVHIVGPYKFQLIENKEESTSLLASGFD